MLAALALTMLMMAGAPAPEPSVEPVTERVVIVAHGPQPPDSGAFAWYRDIMAVNARGESLTLALLWMGTGQKIPPVGATCKVRYRVAR
jgi:hypothetical protein